MKAAQNHRTARSGFSLIELLVVMLIIALLMGLIASAVFKAIDQVESARNKAELTNLDTALAAFKTTYSNVPYYPPSQLKLCSKMNAYGGGQLDLDSKRYLIAMFPGIDQPNSAWNTSGIDWSATGNTNGTWTLSGDQCLVFFLGGPVINSNGQNACIGFSTDNTNPARQDGPRRPSFSFRGERLTQAHTGSNPFYSYKDYYGKNVIAYFSAYGDNRYDTYGGTDFLYSDVNGAQVFPYVQINGISGGRAPVFWNRNTCQLISAGKDGVFGPGSQDVNNTSFWQPTSVDNLTAGGRDDQTNFYDKQMGVPTM